MHLFRPLLYVVACAALIACSPFSNRETPRPSVIHTLDDVGAVTRASQPSCYTLTVNSIRSAPGYGTARMAYTRAPHRIEYFAYNRWADSPASMLHPILIEALERTGRFAAVLTPTAPQEGVLRLDMELATLRQLFENGDSRIQLVIRARLFAHENLVANHLFRVEEEAGSGPESGVVAANEATARFTAELIEWLDASLSKARPACN